MTPIWAWFGYDEPNYTYMKDGKKLLSELAALSPVPVYVRAHNLLTSGDGIAALKWGSTNAYTEDEQGKPVYNWTIVDSIFDTYIGPVSYTHLRAHETVLDLVCRLLLENKNTHTTHTHTHNNNIRDNYYRHRGQQRE